MKLLFAAMACFLAASPALACDCMMLDPSFPRYASDLDSIAKFYPVAVEGRLEKLGPHRWRVIPSKELKGLGQASYAIELGSDCSLDPAALDALVGKRRFFLLSRIARDPAGPFEINRCVSGLKPPIERAIRERISICNRR